MKVFLFALLLFETFDDLFDFLRPVLVGDQHGVFGFDDDEVADPDRRDQATLRVQE